MVLKNLVKSATKRKSARKTAATKKVKTLFPNAPYCIRAQFDKRISVVLHNKNGSGPCTFKTKKAANAYIAQQRKRPAMKGVTYQINRLIKPPIGPGD